jgi:hypothetical protein
MAGQLHFAARASGLLEPAYASARYDQIEGLSGEAVEIADTEPDVERARLTIDARFALIGRLRRYLGSQVLLTVWLSLNAKTPRRALVRQEEDSMFRRIRFPACIQERPMSGQEG